MQNKQQYFYSPLRFKQALDLASTPNILKNIEKGTHKNDNGQKIQSRISQILSLKKQGKLQLALQKLTILSSQSAQNLRLFQIKGQILFIMKRFQEALNCYENLINKAEASQNEQIIEGQKVRLISLSLYYFNYSLCLQKLGRHKQAIQSLKQAQSKNPNKPQIQVSLAENYQSLGYKDQVIHNILKIREKICSNITLLKKCLQLLTRSSEYLNVIELVDCFIRKESQKSMKEQVRLYLLQTKADCLRKLYRFQQASQLYQDILQVSVNKHERIYENLAFCLQKIQPKKSIDVYRSMLILYPHNVKAANNLANLLIRTNEFQSALEILNKILHTVNLQSLDYHKLTLLKCHKALALISLFKKKQAYEILQQIIYLTKEKIFDKNYSNSQKENIKFVQALIHKYSNTISKVCEIESMNEVPEQITKQAEKLSLQLIGSISLELQSKVNATEKGKDQLEKLSQRINHLYQEILKFKKTTLKDHEVSQLKVHNKIQQIQQILQKKQEQANKLTVDMSVLKKQYNDIFKFIETANQQQTQGVLTKTIANLPAQDKNIASVYSRQFYWIFSAYLVSIRLVANQLVPSGKKITHLSNVGSFFARFKGVFQTVSRVPYIGTVCSAINSLLQLYLSEQSRIVYQTLNRTITTMFIRQQSMQESLEKGICYIVSSQYIGKAYEKLKTKKIISDMSIKNKANEWFQKQKSKLIKKIVNFSEGKESHQEILIKELIIEDIGAILLYIIKNGQTLLKDETQDNFFTFIFDQVLLSNYKQTEITDLFVKNQQKQTMRDKNYESTCSNTCKIY